ncbi:MAG: hypothetical protein AAF799_31425 [Myxococcota bacterium]
MDVLVKNKRFAGGGVLGWKLSTNDGDYQQLDCANADTPLICNSDGKTVRFYFMLPSGVSDVIKFSKTAESGSVALTHLRNPEASVEVQAAAKEERFFNDLGGYVTVSGDPPL